MEDSVSIKVSYECVRSDCQTAAGAHCSNCTKRTIKTTRRAIPMCDQFLDKPVWIEVYMGKDGSGGQQFFHGHEVWEMDAAGDMRKVIKLLEPIPKSVHVYSCNDSGCVRFFVGKDRDGVKLPE